MLAAGVVARKETVAARGLSSVALLAAVGFGVIAQGGYYTPQLIVLTLLVCAAAGLAGWRGAAHPAVWGAAGVAAMAMLSGLVAGDLTGSGTTVAICACAAGAVTVARAASPADRATLTSGLLCAGVVVAGVAWAGVALHLQPLALVDGGLWRGASGLTYANATAAFLVPLALLGLARTAERDSAPHWALHLATYALVVGAGTTLSRGGGLGLAVGAVMLAGLLGWRRCLAAWAPTAFGAAAAVAGLAESMPAAAHPHPLVAGGALTLGAAVTLAGRRLPLRAAPWLAVGIVVVLPTLVAFTPGRWNAASPDRGHATAAAISVIGGHPLLGVSPGRYLLSWTDPLLGPREVAYAHDEYLQLIGEIGLAGFAVAASAATLTARSAWKARSRGAAWCGPVAALAALAVHSGLDFLWHIPLIVVLAGLLVGLAVPPVQPDKESMQ